MVPHTVCTTASVMQHDWDVHSRPFSPYLEAYANLQTILLVLCHVSTHPRDGGYPSLYMLSLKSKESPAG